MARLNLLDWDATSPLAYAAMMRTVQLADRVLLLSSTGIADSGSHAQLLQRNPAYRELLGIEHG